MIGAWVTFSRFQDKQEIKQKILKTNKMKKVIFMMAIAAGTFAFTSCGTSTENTDETTTMDAATDALNETTDNATATIDSAANAVDSAANATTEQVQDAANQVKEEAAH